jgi:anaerobic selenocysteine-containing dehydrogenase
LNSLASPDEAILLHVGSHQQRSGVSLSTIRKTVRNQNLPDCSNMCHESSGTGMKEALGFGKGTVTLEEFDLCDAIFVIGQNPEPTIRAC